MGDSRFETRTHKSFSRGTHRGVDPEVTINLAMRYAAQMGITRVANVTGLDRIGMPVVMVCRPNSRSLAVAQGKGRDLAAAKASGLMESIELHIAETLIRPTLYATYEELRHSTAVVDVDELPAVASSRFHPHLPLLWSDGHDLVSGQPLFLPYEMIHANHTWPKPPGSGCFRASSNGLASGNTSIEALSHAICEVVERDAATLWSLNDALHHQSTRLDLSTVDEQDCLEILERFTDAQMTTAVWDITSDVGIPAFACTVASNCDSMLEDLAPACGFGCHPARGIALLRALTEAAQSRLTAISGARDDMFREQYEHFQDLEVVQQLRDELTNHRGAMRSFRQCPSFASETFEEDVSWEIERLRAVGIRNVIQVDLAQLNSLCVVRVVIPGLEGPHQVSGFVPGRRAVKMLEPQP